MGAWCFSFTINTKMYLTYKIQSIETHIVLAGHFSSSVGIIGGYNGWNSIFPVLTHGLGSVEHREREAGAGSQAGLCSLYQLYRLVKLCHGFWDKRLSCLGRLKYTERLQKIAVHLPANRQQNLILSFLNTKDGAVI